MLWGLIVVNHSLASYLHLLTASWCWVEIAYVLETDAVLNALYNLSEQHPLVVPMEGSATHALDLTVWPRSNVREWRTVVQQPNVSIKKRKLSCKGKYDKCEMSSNIKFHWNMYWYSCILELVRYMTLRLMQIRTLEWQFSFCLLSVNAGDQKMLVKGCASKSICTGEMAEQLQSLGEMTCCEGNLCNGDKKGKSSGSNGSSSSTSSRNTIMTMVLSLACVLFFS